MPVYHDESGPNPVLLQDARGQDIIRDGALPVSVRSPLLHAFAIPVLDTSAYASGDALHILPLMTFGGVLRQPNYSGTLVSLVVEDSTATPQNAAGELWLFDTPYVTLPALNAAWTLVAADRQRVVGVVYFGPYFTSTATGRSERHGINMPLRAKDANLYGLAVTRGAPTYTASSLRITISVQPD